MDELHGNGNGSASWMNKGSVAHGWMKRLMRMKTALDGSHSLKNPHAERNGSDNEQHVAEWMNKSGWKSSILNGAHGWKLEMKRGHGWIIIGTDENVAWRLLKLVAREPYGKDSHGWNIGHNCVDEYALQPPIQGWKWMKSFRWKRTMNEYEGWEVWKFE